MDPLLDSPDAAYAGLRTAVRLALKAAQSQNTPIPQAAVS